MMGPQQVDEAALFQEFSLERHVPATHMLRPIDRFVGRVQPIAATHSANSSWSDRARSSRLFRIRIRCSLSASFSFCAHAAIERSLNSLLVQIFVGAGKLS
jgi:hypothetical protein